MFNLKVNLHKSTISGIIAFGSIVIDDAFAVNINVRKSSTGNWFIAFPSYKTKDGEYKDSAFPITKESRELIYKSVEKALIKADLV